MTYEWAFLDNPFDWGRSWDAGMLGRQVYVNNSIISLLIMGFVCLSSRYTTNVNMSPTRRRRRQN